MTRGARAWWACHHRGMRVLRLDVPLPALLVAAVLGAACAAPGGVGSSAGTTAAPASSAEPAAAATTAEPTATPTEDRAGVPEGELLAVRVVDRRPHDTSSYTQGLEFDGHRLFESRGLYGESAITEIDPATGEVLRRSDLAPEFFGEGATVLGDQLLQLTWREQTAFVYDPDTFEVLDQHTYTTEGWGLCDQDGELVMSDGTSTLTFRDPATFEPLRTVEVTRDGVPVHRLNELECVDGQVWANVFQTDEIVVIDPADGRVVSTVDASGLLSPEEAANADVLNGIAYHAGDDAWLVTGKLWPWMFEVTFECVRGCVDPVSVLSGDSRVQTAVAIAQDGFPAEGSAGAAVLARADDFADAVAGTPLAAAAAAPVLLTPGTALHGDTAAELRRALPAGATVFLLGGAAALAPAVEQEVTALGFAARRLSGPSRFETATAIADAVVDRAGQATAAFLATGLDFRNALVAGAAAGADGGVLLLSDGRAAHAATDAWLLGHPLAERHAVGADAIAAYPVATRWGGEDPYATAADLAGFTEDRAAPAIALASGTAFPDALAGGAHAAALDTALLLTEPAALPVPTEQYLRRQAARLERLVVYGGDAAIEPATRSDAAAAIA